MTYSKSKKMEEMSPTRTAQHCAQCTAHGQISLLKGHKKVCPFKECMCVHCILVKNKRHIMAKQVKLKRLQEKNHVRQRRMKDNKTSSLRGPVANKEKKLVYLDDAGINEMQHYQEEAWRAICAQTSDLDQVYLDQQLGSPTGEPWSPVSPVQYNHTGPLQHVHNPCTSIMYPLPSPTTAMNLFSTPVGESEVLNHVFTQPVYYHCLPPDCTQNVALTLNFSDESSSETSLQPLEVASFIGLPHTQMAAAETLLTLRTGDE